MAESNVSQDMDEEDFGVFRGEWPRRIASLVDSGTCRISAIWEEMTNAGHYGTDLETFNTFLSSLHLYVKSGTAFLSMLYVCFGWGLYELFRSQKQFRN